MTKKITFYLIMCLCFISCFLFGKYINTLALGNFNNSIGTIPVQMDIDNYKFKSDNLLNMCIFYREDSITSNGVTTTFNRDNCYLSSNGVVTSGNRWFNITNNKPFVLEPGTYTITLNQTLSNTFSVVFRFTDIGDYYLYQNNSFSSTFTIDKSTTLLYVFVETYSSGVSVDINNLAFQIVEGDVNLPFEPYYNYRFGYNASLYYLINSSGNSTTVNYYFNDNTYTKTTSSVNGDYLIENYYIPFFIDSKGYVSLPNISFGISSISNNSTNITYSLQLELTPVFGAYYKGEYTTNIYTKLNYMSNDLFFSGITFSGCKETNCRNTINAGNLSLTNPKVLAVTEQNSTGNISTTNVSTYYNDDIMNRNYFEYNNYLNVGFRIGNLAETYNFMNGRNYTFGISSLASRIVDNQTTTTPLPNNSNTYNKYNVCSAWYDIPCQLGNAVTYVIYEAPIISPILTFIFSFITMFSNLVTFVDLFSSFGIVFGCFVLYMFIELLNKYSK